MGTSIVEKMALGCRFFCNPNRDALKVGEKHDTEFINNTRRASIRHGVGIAKEWYKGG